MNKLGLKEDYQNRADINDIICCIVDVPLLPAADIPIGLEEIRATNCNDVQLAAGDVRATSMDRHREHHDFHRLVGHV